MPGVALKPAHIQTTSVKAWVGVETASDAPRLPQNGLLTTTNCILYQNGTVRPRWSMALYGTQPPGTILGEIFEFKDTTVLPNLNYRAALINVAGTVNVYYSKDLGTWTIASGKTYSTTAKGHFAQIDNKVLVMNGADNLSYLNISTKAVVPFTALTTPTAPTLTTNTGLTGTTFTITFRIAANSTIGTTIASSVLTTTVSTDRDMWNSTTQSLTIGWSAVASAVSYNVYLGVGGAGTEFLVASGITGLSYTDNGTAYQDTTQSYPLVDSTAGPKATRADIINGQVFLSGITDQQYNVISGGTYPNTLDFSPANGGNTIPISSGGKYLPIRVKLFRSNSGSSAIKVYCDGPSGHGRRFTLSPNSLTVGSQTVSFFDVIEDSGEDGSNSPDAFIYYNDSNYYPSVDGFKTDGTLPQLQNIISTRRVTNTIQPDMDSLNNEAMGGAIGQAWNGRLLFAVPANSPSNSEIWVNEVDRGGGWMKPLTIAADWMMLYDSNTTVEGGDGRTHFLILSGNKVYELTYSQLTNDNGVGFVTSGSSGRIYFSSDQRVCAKLLNVILTFDRPSGHIDATVNGEFRDTPITATGSLDVSPGSSIVGWSEAAWSEEAWSEFNGSITTNNATSKDLKIKVNQEVRWFEYSWSSPAIPGNDYQLSEVVAEYVTTGIRDL